MTAFTSVEAIKNCNVRNQHCLLQKQQERKFFTMVSDIMDSTSKDGCTKIYFFFFSIIITCSIMKMSDELVYYIFGVYVQYTIKLLIDSAYSVRICT